eukprot:9466995-Pyramimonas_sp.AAC.1
MAVGAQHGAEGRAEHHHRYAHCQELPGLGSHTPHVELAPHEPNHRVNRHQAYGRGRGDLLGDTEQQGQSSEAADVDARARNRSEHATHEASDEQGPSAPVVLAGPVLNAQVHVTADVAVQPEQREGERKPDGHEADLLLRGRHPGGDLLQTDDETEQSAKTANGEGPLLNHDAHVEDGEHRSGHAAALDHEGEVAGYNRFDVEGKSHHGEGDGCATLGGRTGDHRAEDHGDGHVVLLLEQVELVVLDHVRPPDKVEKDGRRQDAFQPAVRIGSVLLTPLADQLALREVLGDKAAGRA